MHENGESRVHIGKMIRHVAENRQLSVNALAEKLGKNYRSVYRMFHKAHLDTGLIEELSRVLDHDFFAYYHTCNTADINMLAAENKKLKDRVARLEDEVSRLQRENGLLAGQLRRHKQSVSS